MIKTSKRTPGVTCFQYKQEKVEETTKLYMTGGTALQRFEQHLFTSLYAPLLLSAERLTQLINGRRRALRIIHRQFVPTSCVISQELSFYIKLSQNDPDTLLINVFLVAAARGRKIPCKLQCP